MIKLYWRWFWRRMWIYQHIGAGPQHPSRVRKYKGGLKQPIPKFYQIPKFYYFFFSFLLFTSLHCPARPRENAGCEFACECGFTSMSERGINIHRRWVVKINIQYSSIFIEGEQLKSVSINCKIEIFLFQWRQVWFTKDSDCKRQTAENYPKTAKTEFPEKQSESAGDRGRVHGVTSKIWSVLKHKTWRSWKIQIFATIVSVIAEKCAKCGGNWGQIYDVTPWQNTHQNCRSWKLSQAL